MVNMLSENPDLLKEEGNRHFRNAEYEFAIESYTKAIEINPNIGSFYLNRAAAYIMIKNFESGLEDCKKCLFLDPDNLKVNARFCKCTLALGLIFETEERLKLISSNDGNYPELALYCLEKCMDVAISCNNLKKQKVLLLFELKKFSDAKNYVEEIISIHREEIPLDFMYCRGLCLYYLNHFDKATSHFQHVLKKNPDHTETQKAYKRARSIMKKKEMGNRHFKSNEFKEAYRLYSEALNIDPLLDSMNSILYSNRACTLFHTKDYEKCIEDCKISLQLDPKYTRARIRMAKCYVILNLHEEAVKEWEKIVDCEPTEENRKSLRAAKNSQKQASIIDYYKLLGINKNASEDEIKKAYKKRALQHHPDRHASADEDEKKKEEIKFKQINEAYNVLSDPNKRYKYDNGNFDTCESSNEFNVFNTFFNQGSGVNMNFSFK